MRKNILVTGSKGQLGRTIKELSPNQQYNFVFASRSELDISNSKQLAKLFNEIPFDFCINCAAFTNVEEAEKNSKEAFRINAEAVKILAKICSKHDTVLVHISTDYVFDGKSKTPYKEDSPTNPINKYGESKLKGEKYIQEILSDYFIIRTSWLYSKKYGNNFYQMIIDKAKKGEKIAITTSQTGCPTETESLVRYIFKLLKSSSIVYGVKHYCDNHQMNWYEFANKILTENNLLDSLNLAKANNYITFAKRPKYSVLRNSK